MSSGAADPPYLDQFMATADVAARARPDEVDPELAREVFLEVATLLHDSLALDGLDQSVRILELMASTAAWEPLEGLLCKEVLAMTAGVEPATGGAAFVRAVPA